MGFLLTDSGEEHGYTVRRGVGHYRGMDGPQAAVRVELSRETLERILANRMTWKAAIEQEQAKIDGPAERFERFLSFFEGWHEN